MRLRRLLALVLLATLPLCGCQLSGEVENQAYVLVLGVDRLEDGALELTARVPRIGAGKDAEQGKAASDNPCLTFTVSASSWSQALEALQQATPRRMNLSHIELLIFSRRLAGEPEFPMLTRQIAGTGHLYTNARLVVCRDDARSFVEAGKTVIGSRMSAEIQAMLKHYADQGYIPEACFAEEDFAATSFYSDPAAIWGYVEAGTDDTGDGRVLATPIEQRFCGAALLRQGVFVRALSLRETRLLNLIRGRTKSFPFEWEGRDHALEPMRPVLKKVLWDGGRPTLSLQLELSCDEALTQEEAGALAGEMRQALEALVRDCQQERCDPFGFADIAAGRFLTVREWLNADWRSLYAGADLWVDVSIKAD